MASCGKGAACASAAAAWPALAADAKPRSYARALLTDELGEPFKAAALKPLTNYVFHYPYRSTPAFLLELGRAALPQSLGTREHEAYVWPGGAGPRRSIVAFSAICAHQLVYPTPEVSFISFRRTRARRGVKDELIHCCSENSQYDPFRGARVLAVLSQVPVEAGLGSRPGGGRAGGRPHRGDRTGSFLPQSDPVLRRSAGRRGRLCLVRRAARKKGAIRPAPP